MLTERYKNLCFTVKRLHDEDVISDQSYRATANLLSDCVLTSTELLQDKIVKAFELLLLELEQERVISDSFYESLKECCHD